MDDHTPDQHAADLAPTRRRLLRAGLALPVAAGGVLLGGGADAVRSPQESHAVVAARLRALERRYRARIGLYAAALDDRTGCVRDAGSLRHRADERAPIHSVFKVYAAAAVLRDLDRRGETLRRVVRYSADDLVTYSPITERHVEEGMTVLALCDAAVRFSDNTAANLLLDELGGPAAITRFARSIGDPATRLDRREPDLNEAALGDPRDTTTPRSVAQGVGRLLVGDALERRDREVLRDLMLRNTTSDLRFRAGLPPGWRLADKTGSGEVTYNDVGVAWPPPGSRRPPLVVAALVRLEEPRVEASSEIHAQLMRLAVRHLYVED